VVVSQLVQDGWILKGGCVLRNSLALGHRPQQTPHDLARTRLGQVVTKTNVLGFGDGADFFAHMVAQNFGNLLGFVAGGA
jgi:hypothetical protein